MQVGARRIILGLAVTVVVSLAGVVLAGGQAAPAQSQAAQDQPQLAENFFKNVQVLKGITVDEFMDTMGMFTASAGKCCSGCHNPTVLTESREGFSENTPMVRKTRQMITMMNDINRTSFGGRKRVTCFTCHAGNSNPERVPNLAVMNGAPVPEHPNTMEFVALPDRANQVDQIFAKYIGALGGAQRLAGVTSFVATGTYSGWDTAQSEIPVEIFGKAPDQLTTIVHRREGDNNWTFDGRNGWFTGVDSILPITMNYTGGNAAGLRIEALVALAPTRVQQAFSRWQVSEGLVNDKPVTVLQGTNEGQPPLNLYFDESGLLVRLVRWNESAGGPVPTQYDYSDYREVAGVRRPFRWVRTYTNNRATFALKDVRPNAPIDAVRFAKPAPIRVR